MVEPVNDVSNLDSQKPWREADNILERIALYAQQNPGSLVYTIPDELQARQLLIALAAVYSKMIEENPPGNFEAMVQIQKSLGEMESAVKTEQAFEYLVDMLNLEPLCFYGVEIDVSRVVTRK